MIRLNDPPTNDRAMRQAEIRLMLAIGVLVGSLILAALWLLTSWYGYEPARYETPNQCQEDEPCWDCETMGNLVCGPGNQP